MTAHDLREFAKDCKRAAEAWHRRANPRTNGGAALAGATKISAMWHRRARWIEEQIGGMEGEKET